MYRKREERREKKNRRFLICQCVSLGVIYVHGEALYSALSSATSKQPPTLTKVDFSIYGNYITKYGRAVGRQITKSS